ncbi:unnamed protein product [Calicophoron daubneyi]|uniref:Phosphatidylinositol-3-phosphatase n=1 Tax=Calicophoron daubneyi TaxID=300641 RepID=A0AAV2THU2_CALDB
MSGALDRLQVTQVNDVFYLDHFDGNAHVRGTLHLTLTHVFFIGSSRNQEIWLSNQLISSVERLPLTTGGAPLVIRGKDFRVIRLLIPRERDCHKVYNTIRELGCPDNLSELPCFRSSPPECYWDKAEGWRTFDLDSQYRKLGLPNSAWSLSNMNNEFQVCDTYPRVLCVPATVSKGMLTASSRFRSRGRFPVLTYIHPNGKSALCRSSQPLAGFASRCVEDQLLLEAIRMANPLSSVLYVVDARPALNALTNKAQGKGYEDATVYRGISLQFFDIENIHVVRSSLEKMLKVCQEPAISLDAFASGLEKSGWLRHLRSILEGSYFVAARLHEGSSVLVHCSDGWDRTAQVCSLAQIILDPYYRTLSGFEALIKKEWLFFGHKFSDRCGLTNATDTRENSPIFTQFLDCVRHLIDLCPSKFEYNTELLRLLHYEAYSARYGTFVGCSEKERYALGIPKLTYSVWAFINHQRDQFVNPFYEHADHMVRSSSSLNEELDEHDGLANGIEFTSAGEGKFRYAADVLPNFVLLPQLFKLWHGLYLRWEWRVPRAEGQIVGPLLDLMRGRQILASHRRLLEARIAQMCKLLNRPLEDVLPLSGRSIRGGDESDVFSENRKETDNGCDIRKAVRSVSDVLKKTTVDDVSEPDEERKTSGDKMQAWGSDTRLNSTIGSCLADADSLPPPSVEQLSGELKSISGKWSSLLKRDSPCSVCGTHLVLCPETSHCHVCGTNVCSRCISMKPNSLPGLWSSELSGVCVCQNCSGILEDSRVPHFSRQSGLIRKQANKSFPADPLQSSPLTP